MSLCCAGYSNRAVPEPHRSAALIVLFGGGKSHRNVPEGVECAAISRTSRGAAAAEALGLSPADSTLQGPKRDAVHRVGFKQEIRVVKTDVAVQLHPEAAPEK